VTVGDPEHGSRGSGLYMASEASGKCPLQVPLPGSSLDPEFQTEPRPPLLVRQVPIGGGVVRSHFSTDTAGQVGDGRWDAAPITIRTVDCKSRGNVVVRH
jgi:hypothetical protein